MQKKIAIVSIIVALIIVISVSIGTTYSLWTTSVHQESTNTIDVGCFRIEFSDEGIVGAGNISIDKAYPMQDDAGKTLVPYKFNISNTCSTASSYNVILETLNTSTMDESKLKVYLNDNSIKHYVNNVSEELSEDAKNGMNLTKGYLGAGESITYSLRVWIDYDVTVDTPNIQGKVWNGRIVVNSEATFTKPAFTNKVVGEDNVTLDIDTKNDKTVQTLECYYGNKTSQNEVGTSIGTTQCQYPLTAEYAKFKVTYTDGTTDSSYPLKLIETISLIDKMIDLKSKGATDLEYDGIETLGENGTEDNNLRYVGANPSNYVEFNGELWRIIGLMNNIEKDDGTIDSLVKIIRAESIGNYSWDTSDSSINNGDGINQWGESGNYEGADLMRELNTDYLGNVTVGTDGNWYNSSNNSKKKSMPISTLNSDVQNLIQGVKWSTGSDGNSDASTWTIKNMYTYERSDNVAKMCSDEKDCNDSVERTTSWVGKVALMYPSDYGYSTSGGSIENKETCLNTTLNNWKTISYCKNNSWLNPSGGFLWTLTPHASSNYAFHVFGLSSDSVIPSVYGEIAYISNKVFPAVFLKSSITITGGNGSSTSPYLIK